jgi:tetratricopeptide (TPR) repeat protein
MRSRWTSTGSPRPTRSSCGRLLKGFRYTVARNGKRLADGERSYEEVFRDAMGVPGGRPGASARPAPARGVWRALGRLIAWAERLEREPAPRPKTADDGIVRFEEAERLRAEGRYAEAELRYREILAALGPDLGDHPATAMVRSGLAQLLHVTGRHAEAGAERLIELHAATLGNLAALRRDQARPAEAEALLERALAGTERVLGPDHTGLASILNNLAALRRDQGRWDEAEGLYRRSLAIREAALGPEHPQVATALNNLALLQRDRGRLDEAEPLFRRALAIGEAAHGRDHPDLAYPLDNLAQLLCQRGRHAQAEPLFQRALALREAALGPNSPQVAVTLNNLATLRLDQGRAAEALPLYRRAGAIAEAALGPSHPTSAALRNALATCLRALGRTEEADRLLAPIRWH